MKTDPSQIKISSKCDQHGRASRPAKIYVYSVKNREKIFKNENLFFKKFSFKKFFEK